MQKDYIFNKKVKIKNIKIKKKNVWIFLPMSPCLNLSISISGIISFNQAVSGNPGQL